MTHTITLTDSQVRKLNNVFAKFLINDDGKCTVPDLQDVYTEIGDIMNCI